MIIKLSALGAICLCLAFSTLSSSDEQDPLSSPPFSPIKPIPSPGFGLGSMLQSPTFSPYVLVRPLGGNTAKKSLHSIYGNGQSTPPNDENPNFGFKPLSASVPPSPKSELPDPLDEGESSRSSTPATPRSSSPRPEQESPITTVSHPIQNLSLPQIDKRLAALRRQLESLERSMTFPTNPSKK